ncbi:MAG: hypothetical protein U1E73_05445 [Planctomycetota bacterium]
MSLPRLSAIVVLLLPTAVCAQGKNLLYYGNSLSFFNGGVARIVQGIAVDAGFPAPVYQERLVAGQDLHFHATDPAQVAAIGNFLPAGQTWDVVVVQGLSTEATAALGHPAQFVADAVAILGNVRAHSPAATAVAFQTYARGQGHSYYPGTFANPLAMHGEVRTNYRSAVAALVAAYGPGAAVNSAVGDCAALFEFDPSVYNVDLQHPANSLTVMSAMCLFSSIYSRRACDVTPNFAGASPLAAILTSFGMNLATWQQLAGVADRCAAPTLRRYPGSGDNLLLETDSQPGQLTACPVNSMTTGTVIEARLTSLNGVCDGVWGWLLADVFATGQPPAPLALYPEIRVDVQSMVVLQTAPNLLNPLTLSVQMPFTLPGASILVQGIAWHASSETGNSLFMTTDAHEFVFH